VGEASWLTSEQAAARLGVKLQTLYAYVSRGQLTSEPVPGTRRSRFRKGEVERLAAGRRAGGRAGQLEVVIESELTLLDPAGRLAYRGWDATDAARSSSFEQVASWLWHGERTAGSFAAVPALVDAARPAVEALVALGSVDRARVAVLAMRTADPLRNDRRPQAVAATGRSLIGSLVDVLGPCDLAAEGLIAARLWPTLGPTLGPTPPAADGLAILDALLVLLADHELAASTMAVRMAASTWADPYLCVSAGLAALGGPLHGGATERARRLLRDADETTAARAIGDRLAAGEHVPGFGHRVYTGRDPRADFLLVRLEEVGALPPAARGVLDVMHDRNLPCPNVDFAIAAIAEAYRWDEGAGETVFAIARTAGWLGHAAEEYAHRLRYRTRAAYIGPPLED